MPHSEVAYLMLAQISIASGLEVYLDPIDKKPPVHFNEVGAKFIKVFTKKAALMYRVDGSKHYLKIVGPSSPKGGGFYLSPKLPLKEFISWLDAFSKGFLAREIAIKLGADIEPPYTMIEKLTFLEEHGPIPDLNKKFHTPLHEWGHPALLDTPAPAIVSKPTKKNKKNTGAL